MTNNHTPQATATKPAAPLALWLVLLAAAGAFALTMGTRQTMGLFLSALNTSTGLGIGSISLAFAFGQLWWGLTQPFAGAVADRIGTGRVILLGVALVALGTFITPYMTTTAGLIFAIGVLAAGGWSLADARAAGWVSTPQPGDGAWRFWRAWSLYGLKGDFPPSNILWAAMPGQVRRGAVVGSMHSRS